MHVALTSLFVTALLGQAGPENLDFRLGTLAGWEGTGFTIATSSDHRPLGAWSKEEASGRKGMLRFVLTIPAGARMLTFKAYADVRGDSEPDRRLTVVLAGADQVPVKRLVQSNLGQWQPSSSIQLPWVGKPRTYGWDVSIHQGKLMQVVLIDQDDRPGHFLYAGGFRFLGSDTAPETVDPEFSPFMQSLQEKHNLIPMAKFDSKRFTAISNANDSFTTSRLRNCETFYDLFLAHFRAKGFAVHPPTQRLMIAIFDSHEGFDAYFGQKMPAGVAGVYHTPTNRLVLYDFAENRGLLASKDAARKRVDTIFDRAQQTKYLDTTDRKISDFARDANLSTTMHECAHQISFNCGLLNREANVPLWLAEGLATYCEATDQGDWTVLGGMNPMRLSHLHQARGTFLPLADLVRNDDWLRSRNVLLGYAQSWCLYHMLMVERTSELRRYLDIIRDRKTPETRLADFQEAFGSIARMDLRYRTYLNDLLAKSRPIAQR